MDAKLKRALGNWVEGDRFWDREAELELLVEYLEEGAHLLIVAQRRIGKTSLMREAARRLARRFTCLQVDLQKSHSPADAIVELSIATRPHGSLWQTTKGVFSSVLGQAVDMVESLQLDDLTVTLRSGVTAGDWQAKGDRLFETLAAAEKEVVVFLDEVPILVSRILHGDDFQITPDRRRETDAFMSWLRDNCIRHRGKVRVVVTGSIGIEPILRRAGLSATLNVLTPFELGPWDRETAAECLEALANGYGLQFQPGAIEALLDHLGVCIPHHVQMFFDNLYRTAKLRKLTSITRELIDEVYEQNMLSVRGHAELSHLEERLKLVLGPHLHPLALDLLTEAAVSWELTPTAALALAREHLVDDEKPQDEVREILGILEHDGYLQREPEGGYAFVSKLLRDWWHAHFGFAFVPALERRE
ncbi:MAG: ATP-binding protein [bacterium]|nr:ATP-binding protein [bacterium]